MSNIQQEDLRSKILDECLKKEEIVFVSAHFLRNGINVPTEKSIESSIGKALLNAMDEYLETRGKELLQFMADNNIQCETGNGPIHRDFYYKGEWITKEALFQNFL